MDLHARKMCLCTPEFQRILHIKMHFCDRKCFVRTTFLFKGPPGDTTGVKGGDRISVTNAYHRYTAGDVQNGVGSLEVGLCDRLLMGIACRHLRGALRDSGSLSRADGVYAHSHHPNPLSSHGTTQAPNIGPKRLFLARFA